MSNFCSMDRVKYCQDISELTIPPTFRSMISFDGTCHRITDDIIRNKFLSSNFISRICAHLYPVLTSTYLLTYLPTYLLHNFGTITNLEQSYHCFASHRRSTSVCVRTTWPDLPKFYPFGKLLNVFGKLWGFIWYLAKILTSFGTFLFYWANVIVVNGQTLEKVI